MNVHFWKLIDVFTELFLNVAYTIYISCHFESVNQDRHLQTYPFAASVYSLHIILQEEAKSKKSKHTTIPGSLGHDNVNAVCGQIALDFW